MTRWTPELLADVRKLRFEKLWTLQMIADQYGVTRERIRQVIGEAGRCVTSKKSALYSKH